MPSGWVSAWFGPPSSQPRTRCTRTGTADWSMRNSSFYCSVALSCLCLPGVICAADPRLFEAVEPHMGSLVRIQLYATDADQANRGFHAAFGRIAQLDAALSDYKPE